MFGKQPCTLPLFIVILYTFLNVSCSYEIPVEPDIFILPELTDPIPYEMLGQGKLVFERICPLDNCHSGVYVIDIDKRRSWGIGGGVINGPSISPDGQSIAYTSYTDLTTAYDVYIMNNDGTNRRRVSDIEGQERAPSWTTDGKYVLFYSFLLRDFSHGFCPLYRQSPVPNPPDRKLIIDFGRIDTPFVYIPEGPVSASITGELVVSTANIYKMNFDGSDFRSIVPRSEDYTMLHSPVWSPDGENIAYLSLLYDSSFVKLSISIILNNGDGDHPDTLVTLSAGGSSEWSGANTYSVCWSPDGSKIAFTRPVGPEIGSHIYIINRDGTSLMQVTTAEGVTDRSLSWSN